MVVVSCIPQPLEEAMDTVSTLDDLGIESTPKPQQSHWAHMREVGDHLAGELLDMIALTRVATGVGTPSDLRALDIGEYAEPTEAVSEFVNSWALDVQATDDRIKFILGTGGPHVELDVLLDSNEHAEEVILRRYWTQKDRAWTESPRALAIVDDFLDVTGIIENAAH